MTNSSFYADGYRDRANNRPISLPDANVYKNEYLNGYRHACSDAAASMSNPAYVQPSANDCQTEEGFPCTE